MGKSEIRGGKQLRHMIIHGLSKALWSLKAVTSQLFKVYRFLISHSYTKNPRIYDQFDILTLFIIFELAIFFLISIIF